LIRLGTIAHNATRFSTDSFNAVGNGFMHGLAMHGSLRLIIIVTVAVAAAIASFANSFALTLGVAAATVGGAIVVIIVLGAITSIVREKPRDRSLSASNRPDDAD